MNIINKQYKVVTYLGMTLAVPVDVKWIATDSDGCCYGFHPKPSIEVLPSQQGQTLWRSSGYHCWLGDIHDIPSTFDWKQSLVHVGD